MMKTLTTLTAAATLAIALAAAPTDANAQFRRWGPAVGLGILGGAVLGSIIANQYGPQYVVEPGYEPYGYRAAAPVGCPGGYWARRQFVDQWGNVRWSRPRFFCPEY